MAGWKRAGQKPKGGGKAVGSSGGSSSSKKQNNRTHGTERKSTRGGNYGRR
jgi:uncharacterized protein YjcR